MRLSSVRLLAIFLFALPAWSSVFFGPRTYTVNTGAPETVVETIALHAGDDCNGKAAFILVLENGDGTMKSRVTGGRIALNGVDVIPDSDFQLGMPHVERPIRLTATNTLAVELKGGHPGAFVKLSIRREANEPLIQPLSVSVASTRHGFSSSFAADPAGEYVLTVENGDQTGSHRARTGSIVLNGLEIIGERDLHGSTDLLRRSITLQTANTLQVKLGGTPDDAIVLAINRRLDDGSCSIAVEILSPEGGARVTSPRIRVRGTAIGPPDIGISVNGSAAEIALDHDGTPDDPFPWFAEIEAPAGEVILTARVSTPAGTTRDATRTVTFAPESESVTLTPIQASGVVPFSAMFSVSVRSTAAVALYELDLDGGGTFEIASTTLPDPLTVTYETPAIVEASVRATLADGRILRDSALLMPRSFLATDQMLRRVWTAFLTALSRADVDAALAQLGSGTAQKYRPALMAIRPGLPRYAAAVGQIHPKTISGNVAHYLIVREHEGRRLGYHLYFTRGNDGIWRISQF